MIQIFKVITGTLSFIRIFFIRPIIDEVGRNKAKKGFCRLLTVIK
jgi:hypothetical protein